MDLYLYSLFIILLFNTLIFIISIIKKDNSIADIFYSFGFILSIIFSLFYFSNQNILSLEKILLSILIIIWGIRLSYRIYNKNKNKTEDFRYATWREEWNKKGKLYFYVRSYLQIFILQGIIASIIVLPSLYFNSNSSLFYFGFSIAIFGLIYESTADYQLDKFLKQKNNQLIMQEGLWKYSRHPNYFGEAVFWWGVFIATFSINTFYFMVSPILITYLLRCVSGVPMLERKWNNHSDTKIKELWYEYKNKTPAMLPRLF